MALLGVRKSRKGSDSMQQSTHAGTAKRFGISRLLVLQSITWKALLVPASADLDATAWPGVDLVFPFELLEGASSCLDKQCISIVIANSLLP
jgi:hypothetical protein